MRSLKFLIFTDIDLYKYEDWLNVGYLSNAIKKSFYDLKSSVDVVDSNDVDSELIKIQKEKPDYICLSILQENYNVSMKFIKKIKECYNSVFIILENRVPTLYAKFIMKTNCDVDAIIMGEGDLTIVELISSLNNNLQLDNCKGLMYRKGNEIIETNPRELVSNLDSLGFPDRFEVDKNIKTFSIKGSRGCDGNCTFCDLGYTRMQKGKRVRYHSIEHIVEEMETLNREYKVKHFHFFDDTFCGPDNNICAWLQKLFNVLSEKKLDIRFLFMLRAELIADEKVVQLLYKLKSIGLDHIFLGLESGNQDDLSLFNKRATVEDNRRAVYLLQKYDIQFDYGFVMFNPYSTFERLSANVDFIEESNLYVNMDVFRRRLLLLPGTSILKILDRDGLLVDDITNPAIDKMGYHFQDIRVESAMKATFNIFEKSGFKAEEHYVRLISFYNNVEAVYGKNNYKVIELKEVIHEFKDISRKYSINLMREILLHAENGVKNIEEKVNNQIKEYIDYMNNIYLKVQKCRIPLAVHLFRENKLYLREIISDKNKF